MKPSELRDTIKMSLLAAALPNQVRLEALLDKWCNQVAQEFIDRFQEVDIKDLRFECLMLRNVKMREAIEAVLRDLESAAEHDHFDECVPLDGMIGVLRDSLDEGVKGGES